MPSPPGPPLAVARWNEPTRYERWFESSLGRAYTESITGVLRPWIEATPGERAIDIGCGPCLLLERLFPPERCVWGADCSLEMAQRARLRRGTKSNPREIVVCTIESLAFADESFDLVLCVNCLEFVADRARACRELARILRPGGRAFIGVLHLRSLWEVTRRLRRPFSRRPYYRGRFLRKEDLEAECAAAGLEVEDVQSAVWFPPIPPGPLASLCRRLDAFGRRRSPTAGAVLLCRAAKPR